MHFMFYNVKDYDAKWTDLFEIYRHKIVHYNILFCIEFTYLFFAATIAFISFFIYPYRDAICGKSERIHAVWNA